MHEQLTGVFRTQRTSRSSVWCHHPQTDSHPLTPVSSPAMSHAWLAWLCLWSTACLLLIGTNTANGGECRVTQTVVNSATGTQQNSDAGGHIWKHIDGLRAKPRGATGTQEGKTLFENEADFNTAWTNWKGMANAKPTPKKCGTHATETDCVSAEEVGIDSAFKCTRVDDTTGLCTRTDPVQPIKVAFRYAKNGDTKNKWILMTAYPSENSNCN